MKAEIVERFMEYIKVTNENIDKEHICCAISNNNDIQVSSKKEWLKEQFREGLRSVYKELHADHETGAADNK